MKNILLTIFAVCFTINATGQKRILVDRNEHIILKFDPNKESISVPGMDDFGLFNGYFGGWNEKKGEPYIYGVWVITSFKQTNPNVTEMRLSYDQGSETQSAELVQTSDSTWSLTLRGTTVIKRATGRKQTKAPTTYHLTELK